VGLFGNQAGAGGGIGSVEHLGYCFVSHQKRLYIHVPGLGIHMYTLILIQKGCLYTQLALGVTRPL
jgi:hypothetical protein